MKKDEEERCKINEHSLTVLLTCTSPCYHSFCDSPRHRTTWQSIDPVHINHLTRSKLLYLGNESPTEANVRLKIVVEEDDAATVAEAFL